jgi:hypothetical protein
MTEDLYRTISEYFRDHKADGSESAFPRVDVIFDTRKNGTRPTSRTRNHGRWEIQLCETPKSSIPPWFKPVQGNLTCRRYRGR